MLRRLSSRLIPAAIVLTSLCASPAWADLPPTPPPVETATPAVVDPAASASSAPTPPPVVFHPQKGNVVLPGGLASLEVPSAFGYLSPDEASTLLYNVWGNPLGPKPLGVIVPEGFDPFADESWAVIITYQDDGHVSDEDADSIDYKELLEQMQESARQENSERTKEGYPSIELVGWATPPHYDKPTHKLYWAKDVVFGSGAVHTLNYNVRVLGKEGVLVLNAVADMNQLAQVEKGMQTVLGFVEFTQGNRYQDFDPSTGRMAAYGIGGLILAGAAAKSGLLKVILAGLLASKKLIVALVAAVGAGISRVLRRKSS